MIRILAWLVLLYQKILKVNMSTDLVDIKSNIFLFENNRILLYNTGEYNMTVFAQVHYFCTSEPKFLCLCSATHNFPILHKVFKQVG